MKKTFKTATLNKAWRKVCKAHGMKGTEADYEQWREETREIVCAIEEAAYDIASADNIDIDELEQLLRD